MGNADKECCIQFVGALLVPPEVDGALAVHINEVISIDFILNLWRLQMN